jgi:hypothetical protein
MRSGSVKTASDSKYYSIDEKSNESIQSYKSEISRLNKMVNLDFTLGIIITT